MTSCLTINPVMTSNVEFLEGRLVELKRQSARLFRAYFKLTLNGSGDRGPGTGDRRPGPIPWFGLDNPGPRSR